MDIEDKYITEHNFREKRAHFRLVFISQFCEELENFFSALREGRRAYCLWLSPGHQHQEFACHTLRANLLVYYYSLLLQ